MMKLNTACERAQNILRRKAETEDEIIELIYMLECLGYYTAICGTVIITH
jgi:hypothetical protein